MRLNSLRYQSLSSSVQSFSVRSSATVCDFESNSTYFICRLVETTIFKIWDSGEIPPYPSSDYAYMSNFRRGYCSGVHSGTIALQLLLVIPKHSFLHALTL